MNTKLQKFARDLYVLILNEGFRIGKKELPDFDPKRYMNFIGITLNKFKGDTDQIAKRLAYYVGMKLVGVPSQEVRKRLLHKVTVFLRRHKLFLAERTLTGDESIGLEGKRSWHDWALLHQAMIDNLHRQGMREYKDSLK